MRLILVGVVLVVVGVGLWAAGPTGPDPAPEATPVAGGEDVAPRTGSAAPVNTTEEPERTMGDGIGAVTSTTSTEPEREASTTTLGDIVGPEGYAGEGSEPPPRDPGALPISSNLGEGVDYPLETMVERAVSLLRAETTGEGSEGYPHLADMLSVCCRDLAVNRAVVVFGDSRTDPATIILSWQATDRTSGARVSTSTRSLWWWVDGSWVGEFEGGRPGSADSPEPDV